MKLIIYHEILRNGIFRKINIKIYIKDLFKILTHGYMVFAPYFIRSTLYLY